ncbi:glycine cleavage system protein GcvH [Kineosporia mesophila]|uniref:Glycine cleavage system H protein n=1 Tax=Kineosporia mesophila TaxID=566012 RepID=A0ABP6ZPF7_9ACTN|nr:glycine cleavage system protein GcvH [Kineosporia mesophila]
MSDFEYPDDLKYTTDHEWMKVDGNVVRVGITAFAQEALGDIVYVTLPDQDAQVESGTTCGEVESTKSVSDVYAPVTGAVTKRNEALDTTPELVNSDPYGEGWMFEVTVPDATALTGLLSAAEYQSQLD